MGAQQSTGHDPSNPPSEPTKRCYYEVLEIDRQASEDEIKKAYRKKALELHPDRNYGDVVSTTAKFAEVQSAYEVLSDPQERAWYDSHRESILHGDKGPAEDNNFSHDIRLTSAFEIVTLIGKFNSRVQFTDSPTGFFGILQQTFEKLAKEEASACDWEGLELVDYPEFGHKDDTYEDGVRDFYRVWINFSTKKTFSWRDAYRASDAPDRATRRAIDKENKRLRDEGIREFNDAVRSLVAFARKRDPRFTPNSQSEAERQKTLRDLAAAQAAKSRAANQAKLNAHVVPDWARSQQPADEGSFSESEEEEVEEIECVICRKTFKSEKQYETHERSKKHIKAVQQLQREMRREDASLNLKKAQEERDSSAPASELDELDLDSETSKDDEPSSPTSNHAASDDEHDEETQNKPEATLDKNPTTPPLESPSSEPDNDEYTSRQEVENRLTSSLLEQLDGTRAAPSISGSEADGGGPKLGKAAQKRAKKKAKQESNSKESLEATCTSCNETFPSKNALFGHIKENPTHAKLVSKPVKGNKKKKK